MGGRAGAGRHSYFEGLRAALARFPEGLVRAGAPARQEHLAAAEARLGRVLPPPYRAFLESFDGADLFHGAYCLYGVGPTADRDLVAENARASADAAAPGEPVDRRGALAFAEDAAGDCFVLAPGETAASDARVLRLRAGSDERWLSGSALAPWLEAIIARESLLYDAQGEFVPEAFEADGQDLVPVFALRAAERALRKDPGSAEWHHDKGVALRRMGKTDRARAAFAEAQELDPENPWPAFDRGRAALDLGRWAEAVAAFLHAAEAAPGPAGARFCAWAARAAKEGGRPRDASAARAAALARDPDIVAALERAAAAAARDDEPAALAEAAALHAAFCDRAPDGRRLPVAR